MTSANIQINGVAASNDTLPINTLVQLNNVNSGGETTYLWEILDQPDGTTDVLSSAVIQNPTFTPKKEGSYIIRLTVNQSLGDQVTNTKIAAVRQLKSNERIPSAFETFEIDPAKGWKPAVNRLLSRLDDVVADSNLIVCVCDATPPAIGDIVQFSGVATIKAGLPGQEDLAVVSKAPASVLSAVAGPLGIVIGTPTGGSTGAGVLAVVRRFGLVELTATGSPTVGDPVFVSDASAPSLTAGTNSKKIGRVVALVSGGYKWVLDGSSGGGDSAAVASMVSVKQDPFLATGDGVTDDRAAIQAADAHAASLGLPLYFPPGTYRVSLTPATFYSFLLSGRSGVAWVGAGPGQSTIKSVDATGLGVMLQISNCKGVSIRDLTLDGNWGNAVTSIAAASHGATLPTGTINVASTAGFPTSGTMRIILSNGAQDVTYTNKTSTSFTGCTGGTGTLIGDGDLGRIGSLVGYGDPGHTHVTVPSDGATLPTATINVNDTSVFPASGQIFVTSTLGDQIVTYTGKTSTTFTGCTGGTGVINTGAQVWSPTSGIRQVTQRDPQNRLIFLYGLGGDNVGVEITNCHFHQAYGDGIWIGGDGTGGGQSQALGGTRNVRIDGCEFDMCARNGITMIYCDNVSISRCTFKNIFTTAIDTEPVLAAVTQVAVDDVDAGLWWNTFHDTGNVLSIQGGVVTTPAEWNLVKGYRLTNSRLSGSVLISDAIDVTIDSCEITCDFAATGIGAPIIIDEFVDDCWITNNYLMSRSGATDTTNRGVVNLIRLQIDANSSTQPAGVMISGNSIHARNGMDGIYVYGTGGADGYKSTASSITGTTLTDSAAAWTTNQFIGQTVTRGAVTAVVASNTSTVLTLATWHNDGVHGWTTARGQPVSAPSAGAYTIHASGGVVALRDNKIDTIANDGNSAGQYGIHLSTLDAGNSGGSSSRMRVDISHNKIQGANPYGIFVFVASEGIAELVIQNNFIWDNQPVPTCTHGIFFESQGVQFNPNTQTTKLVIGSNLTDQNVREPIGGLDIGYWIAGGSVIQQLIGYGSPEGVVIAPVGSDFRRLDGVTGGVLYIKEVAGLQINDTSKTDRTGDVKSTDQTLTLDAVTTTIDFCLVVQSLCAVPGSGASSWDQWTNAGLIGFAEIFQTNSSSGGGDFAAAAGALAVAGSSGAGSVRQHAVSAEFGNATYSFALAPQVPGVAPVFVSSGPIAQDATSPIDVHWPDHLRDDVGILYVQVPEGATATVSDPHWVELPNSPISGAFSGVGVVLKVFGARAYKGGDGAVTGMPFVTVTGTGATSMGQIQLFRGAVIASANGWVAK